tara:strand:+ start:4659 stop:4832 length:174 start_codon:yes stop_codon:yes gene_type:complete
MLKENKTICTKEFVAKEVFWIQKDLRDLIDEKEYNIKSVEKVLVKLENLKELIKNIT